MPVLADDDVIVHGHAERTGDVDGRACHLDVGLRGCRIAGASSSNLRPLMIRIAGSSFGKILVQE